MEIVDLFMEKSKDKFLNMLIKIPKAYDWYLGIVIKLDDYTLLLFGTDPIPYNSNIKGVIKSVCKYLDCKIYEANYIKYLRDMVFDPWGEQNYHYIIGDNKAYDLRAIKED